MATGFLRVKGNRIVDGNGTVVLLHGASLGGALKYNFINGYPGSESFARAAMLKAMGAEHYEYFFDRFLHHFFTEKDVEYLKSLGINSLRIPFGYKHFEDNMNPRILKDGAFTGICTDDEWKVSTGSLVTSEIYDGEVCDLNREPKGWQRRGFYDSVWEPVRVLPLPNAKLVSPTGPPVRKIEELPAREIVTSPPGRTIVDFGQNSWAGILTDCPQRDERLGGTGDIHIFAPTANYLYDTCGMLQSWITDLAAEQLEDGSGIPPHFCPNVLPQDPKAPAAIWGDAVIGLPWALYQAYGDPRILSDQLTSMQGWFDQGIPRDEATGLWRDDSYRWQYGDWLDPKAPPSEPADPTTDTLLVANAYLVHMTSIMHEIGRALNRNNISEKYSRQAQDLKATFQRRYITPEGRVVSDTQTGLALALAIIFNLFETAAQEAVAATTRASKSQLASRVQT
ncbi:bacterial alpha-L-rhamnosidase-domain-containing protein [Aspergillus carlsbadensis]|nr:bacterial alpha-L-rhamnosidase-domain-containing protein [Aspergillus carlsbadensis]